MARGYYMTQRRRRAGSVIASWWKRKRGRRGYAKKKKMYLSKGASRRTGFLPVVQKVIENITIPAGAYPTGFISQRSFNILGIANLAELIRLFDQYRICNVKYQIYPQTNTSDTINPGSVFASSIDLDGGSILTFDQLLACSNAKVSNFSSNGGNIPTKTIYVKPRFRDVIVRDPGPPIVYGSTLGDRGAWIDLADGGSTEHFGLNLGWLPATPLSADLEMQCVVTYHVQFRKIR